jgi:hypothetical protein
VFTPYSWITYDGDGTTDTFGVPFSYVAREHVHVYLGWDPSTRSFSTELVHDVDFTYASGNEITLTVPPGALEELTLLRITPIGEQLTEWQTGSPPTTRELDVADRQVLYAVQEFIDQTLQTREDLDDAVLVGAGVTLIDNLSSVLTNAALTANQGRVLRLLIEAVEAALQSDADAAQAAADAAQAAADAAQADADAAQSTADGRSRLILGTVASPSGVSLVDFTGIPSWAKRITVMFNGLSTNGTSLVYLRLGTSAGVQDTAYFSLASSVSPAGAAGSYSVGIQIGYALAAAYRVGAVTLSLIAGNAWVYTGITGDAGGVGTAQLAGVVGLAGVLDRLRIVTANGTDLFDTGAINIQYEG